MGAFIAGVCLGGAAMWLYGLWCDWRSFDAFRRRYWL